MSVESDVLGIVEEARGLGLFGVAMKHLETGEEIVVNGDVVFPMCSVFKVPILAEAFRQISEGRFRLEDRIELEEELKYPPSGILVFLRPGLRPTVEDLLTLMIIVSDNTATQAVLELVGTENIDAYMHEIGLTKTHMVMSIRDLFLDFLGVDEEVSSQELLAMAEEREPDQTSLAYSDGEENNVSTPHEMNRLMEKIFKAEVLDRKACDKMLEIMLKQQLNDRIPRFLPKGTRVAHKTGTLFPGLRNDSGIIYINENSHCAVTIFTKTHPSASKRDIYEEVADATKIDIFMGRIARSVYDYFAQDRE